MRRRWWRLLLAGVFLPVALVTAGPAAPGQAAAAGSGSEWVDDVSWKFEFAFMADVWCWAPMKFNPNGGGVVTIAKGKCKSGVDTSTGYGQWGEPGTGVKFYAEGPGCSEPTIPGSYYEDVTTSHPDDSMNDIASTIPGGIFAVGPCRPTHVCLEIREPGSMFGGGGTRSPECQEVEWPPSGGGKGHCTRGTPTFAGYDFVRWGTTPIEQAHAAKYAIQFDPVQGVQVVGAGQDWHFRLVFQTGAEGYGHFAGNNLNGASGWSQSGYSGPNAGSGTVKSGAPPSPSPVGVMIWWSAAGNVPYQGAGFTDADACQFYFGPKLLNRPGDDHDEPWGALAQPVEPAPAPTEPPGGTDDDVKPTDDVGWLEALWSLLRDLLGAIGRLAGAIAGLAAAIVSGITEALLSLFVPSDGFFEQKMEALKNSAQGTTIGNYADAVQAALTVPSATGCEGPAVNMGSGSETSHPLSACGEPVSTLAALSRLILTASLGIAGALACVRILGSAIGWQPVSTS